MEKKRKTTNEVEPFDLPNLPKDVLPLIFSFIICSTKKFYRLSLVCKYFRELLLLHSDLTDVQEELLTSVITHGHTHIVQSLSKNPTIDFVYGIPATAFQKGHTVYNSATIYLACKYGHVDIVKLLLQCPKIDPSTAKNLPLNTACELGYLEIVQLLLNCAAVYPNWESLDMAISNGHTEILKTLLNDDRVRSAVDYNIVFQDVIGYGYADIVQLFLTKEDVDPSYHKNAAIISACRNGHVEIVKLLLQDIRVDPGDNGNKALRLACAGLEPQFYEIVKLLLQDSRVIIQNQEALWSAVTANSVDIVQLLLLDPRINPAAEFNRVLVKVVDQNAFKILELLLQHPSIDPSFNDQCCLLSACCDGFTETVQLLLQHPKTDPAVAKNLPLRSACERGFSEIVSLLLKDPRVSPEDADNSAIKLACENGYEEVVELLLADPRVNPTVDKDYCFLSACREGHSAIVQLFLDNGIIVPVCESIECVEEYNNEFIVNIFLTSNQFNPIADYLKSIVSTMHSSDLAKLEELLQDSRLNTDFSTLTKNEVINTYLQDPEYNDFADDYYLLNYACDKLLPDALVLLLKYKKLESDGGTKLLRKVCKRGFTKAAEMILNFPNMNACTKNMYCLRIACKKGYTDLVELLLRDPDIDPSVSRNYPCRMASKYGYSEILELLLRDERVNPGDRKNESLVNACRKGHYQIVKLLLCHQLVDPTAKKHKALRIALKNEQFHVVSLLLQDSRIKF